MAINASGAAYGYIYAITQLTTGRYYIGQTRTSVRQRWFSHVCSAKPNANCIVDRAIARRGIGDFVCETVAYADSQEHLDNLERLWIIATDSRNHKNGFNARHGGDGGGKISDESRRKMSDAAKRRVANDSDWADRNRRIAIQRRGMKRNAFTAEARANLSAGQLRRHLNNPDEVVQMGIRNKVAGRANWAKLTPEEKSRRLKPMREARWRRNGN